MITKEEMIEVMDIYIEPLYKLIGAGIAVLVIGFAVWIVLGRFLRRF